MSTLQVNLPFEASSVFCRKWQITRLEVFGSALRENFRPDSDIDFLASFAPDSRWSLFDHGAMEEELAGLLHYARQVVRFTSGQTLDEILKDYPIQP